MTPAVPAPALWFHRDGSQYTGKVTATKRADTAEYLKQDKCSRCGGAGGSQRWAYTGFTCYECGGSGKGKIRTVKVYTAEKIAKLQAAAAKREVKRVAKVAEENERRAAEFAKWSAANAEALAKIETEGGNDTFISDLLQRVSQGYALSEKQIAAALAAVDRIVAKREAEARLSYVGTPGERVTLQWTTDKIISLDDEDGGRRWGQWARRFLVIAHDERGNHLKYIGSSHFPAEGETKEATVTIREHAEYRGQKQTVVERPRFAEAKQAEVA